MTLPAHEEIQGYPQDTYSPDGFRATRLLQCDWTDRQSLAEQLLAGAGMQYPYNLSVAAKAKTVSIVGYGRMNGTGAVATYEKARLTVGYETGSAEQANGLLVEESVEPSVEALRLPVRETDYDADGVAQDGHPLFRWKTGDQRPLDDNEAPVRTVRTADYNVVIHEVATIPSAVYDLMGHTNNATVTANLLGGSYPAGTLLYYAPKLTRQTTAAGVQAWRVAMSFGIRPNGWNKFWRVDIGDWDTIQAYDPNTDTWSDYQNFPAGDFSDL